MAELCTCCLRPKANQHCDMCQALLCKSCVQFLDAATFSFQNDLPEELTHSHYCPACYEAHVEPALKAYNETLENARNLYVFFIEQKRQPPILKRSKEKIRVEACDDRDETILRLGFLAAQQGFNAIIETEVVAKKVGSGTYQKACWQGVAVPATVDAERLERRTPRQ